MVPKMDPEVHELQLSLSTITQELAYERSLRTIECVTKDEDIRKLRFQIMLLEDENNDLHEQLEHEQERGDNLDHEIEDVLAREGEIEERLAQNAGELRMKEREIEILKAEFNALQTVSSDGTKLLTEKLALARELATLKPELEHLRSQMTTQQGLLAEKLSLQRQLTTIQVELENEKRSSQRAWAKHGKSSEAESDSQSQIDDLKKELVKEKREREKVEKALREAQSASDERAPEKPKASEAKSSAQNAELKSQLDETKKELAKEKREREKAERAVQKSQTDWESQKSLLDDKLNAFRTKLRTTKEKLKETEVALAAANTAATARPQAAVNTNNEKPGAKNPRKRAAPVDPDATIGTPGDTAQPKRGKRAATATALGDKSTFSITPFLNKTTTVTPDSPIQEEDEEEEDVDAALKEAQKEPEVSLSEPSATSPLAVIAKAPEPKKSKALANASSVKTNAKPRKKAGGASSKLAQVPEEPEPAANENKPQQQQQQPEVVTKTTTTTVPLNLVPKVKSLSALTTAGKPRKSLADFTSFTNEPEPQRRKRKLLGGGAKTLFDEDDADMPTKPIPGKGMFGRTFSKGGFMGLAGGVKGMKKGNVMVVEGDFAFSPLKRDRRAGSVAR